jgi:hypothetical protein
MNTRLPRVDLVLVLLEVLLSVGALGGGAVLILDPTGGILTMPVTMLEHSPFTTFLVPGVVLLLANGVFPLVVAVAALRRAAWVWLGHVAVGAVLVGWICIQVAMIRAVASLHLIYFALGVVILALGLSRLRHAGPMNRGRFA